MIKGCVIVHRINYWWNALEGLTKLRLMRSLNVTFNFVISRGKTLHETRKENEQIILPVNLIYLPLLVYKKVFHPDIFCENIIKCHSIACSFEHLMVKFWMICTSFSLIFTLIISLMKIVNMAWLASQSLQKWYPKILHTLIPMGRSSLSTLSNSPVTVFLNLMRTAVMSFLLGCCYRCTR